MDNFQEFYSEIRGLVDKHGKAVTPGCYICVGLLGRARRVDGITYIPDTGHLVLRLERGRPIVLPYDKNRIEVVV